MPGLTTEPTKQPTKPLGLCDECFRMITSPKPMVELFTRGFLHHTLHKTSQIHSSSSEDEIVVPVEEGETNDCHICHTIRTHPHFPLPEAAPKPAKIAYKGFYSRNKPPVSAFSPTNPGWDWEEGPLRETAYPNLKFERLFKFTAIPSAETNPFAGRSTSLDGTTKWLGAEEVMRYFGKKGKGRMEMVVEWRDAEVCRFGMWTSNNGCEGKERVLNVRFGKEVIQVGSVGLVMGLLGLI